MFSADLPRVLPTVTSFSCNIVQHFHEDPSMANLCWSDRLYLYGVSVGKSIRNLRRLRAAWWTMRKRVYAAERGHPSKYRPPAKLLLRLDSRQSHTVTAHPLQFVMNFIFIHEINVVEGFTDFLVTEWTSCIQRDVVLPEVGTNSSLKPSEMKDAFASFPAALEQRKSCAISEDLVEREKEKSGRDLATGVSTMHANSHVPDSPLPSWYR